jgi:hypothetical protein
MNEPTTPKISIRACLGDVVSETMVSQNCGFLSQRETKPYGLETKGHE